MPTSGLGNDSFRHIHSLKFVVSLDLLRLGVGQNIICQPFFSPSESRNSLASLMVIKTDSAFPAMDSSSSSGLYTWLSLISLFSPNRISSITSAFLILNVMRLKYYLHSSLLKWTTNLSNFLWTPLGCLKCTSNSPYLKTHIHDFILKIDPILLFLNPSSTRSHSNGNHGVILDWLPESHSKFSPFYLINITSVKMIKFSHFY